MTGPRFKVEPGDVPPDIAARRLGLGVGAFSLALPELLSRGFPQPDPTTGNYDLQAIDAWRRSRHGHLFNETARAPSAAGRVQARLEALYGNG